MSVSDNKQEKMSKKEIIILGVVFTGISIYALWGKPLMHIIGGIIIGLLATFGAAWWRKRKPGSTVALMVVTCAYYGLVSSLWGGSSVVFAWTPPAAGQMGYTAYDFGVNKVMLGPIGNMIATGSMAYGASGLFGPAFWRLIGGGGFGWSLAKGPDLAVELGKLLQ